MTGKSKGTFYSLTDISDDARKKLLEDDFMFEEGDQNQETAGMNRDWPEGRAVFHNNAKTLLIWVNEEDHVRIISMKQGSDIKSVWKRLCIANTDIEKSVKYARDSTLGFLTVCPSNIGTAMSATIQVDLPFLAENID